MNGIKIDDDPAPGPNPPITYSKRKRSGSGNVATTSGQNSSKRARQSSQYVDDDVPMPLASDADGEDGEVSEAEGTQTAQSSLVVPPTNEEGRTSI